MRLFPVFLVAVATTLCFQAAHAQTTSEGWMRVKSDNGEFSIGVPQDHRYFMDRDGFSIGNGGGVLPLLNMRMVSAFTENTLVSFEVYNVKKVALNNLFLPEVKSGAPTTVIRPVEYTFDIY